MGVYPHVGEAIHQALLNLGGSNPDGGVQTILEALVEVAAPPELMPDLFALGQRRLEQQQELHTIPNPTGYLIGIMRHVAVEGMLKGWNVAQMRAEDEEKHAQAVQSAARAGNSVLTYEDTAAPLEEEPTTLAFASDATEPSTVPEPISYLPDGVEVAEAATAAAWQDSLLDPRDRKPRAVSMLWGFVREEIRGHLNSARRQQLDALIPKWDATRPRTLLLLCKTAWDAKAAALILRCEIESQLGKLLKDFFDEMQIVYSPMRKQEEETEGGEGVPRHRGSREDEA